MCHEQVRRSPAQVRRVITSNAAAWNVPNCSAPVARRLRKLFATAGPPRRTQTPNFVNERVREEIDRLQRDAADAGALQHVMAP